MRRLSYTILASLESFMYFTLLFQKTPSPNGSKVVADGSKITQPFLMFRSDFPKYTGKIFVMN